MAHSAWTIPKQPENITATNVNVAKKTAPAKGQESFAAVMAREQTQNGNAAGAALKSGTSDNGASAENIRKNSSQPMVARLPDAGIPLRGNTVLAGRTPNDMLRMQAFNNAAASLSQTKAVSGFIKNATGNATSLDIARNMNTAVSLRTIAAAGNGAGFALTSSDYIHTANTARNAKSKKTATRQTDEMGLGKLSARFESGSDGIAAIGYDSTGGTSYGKYQIASRVGSMKSFLSFLDSEAPDLAKRLRNAGPANTGSRRGGMPNEWRAIAKEQPERFEQLQEAFIHQSHYRPALEAIAARTGIDASSLSAAMREVIWSTAVQHGPAGAAKIFARADELSGKPQNADYERKMITNVYNVRSGQFGSSTSQVREAVRNRFKQEKQLALNLLENGSIANLA